MTHENFRELLPLYVVGALDGDELRMFERHVAEHRAQCEAELAEWQAVADQLAHAPRLVEPGRAVFHRVMAEIEEEEAPRPKPMVTTTPPRERVSLTAVLFRWVPWAAAAVLVAMTAVMIKQTNTMRERFTAGQQATTTQQTQIADLEMLSATQAVAIVQQEATITNLAIRLTAQGKEFLEQSELWKARAEKQRQDTDSLQTANAQLVKEREQLLQAANELRRQLETQRVQVAALEKQAGEQTDAVTRGHAQIAALEARISEKTDALNLLMDPDLRVSQLANPDPKKQSPAVGRVYWHTGKKEGWIVVSNLEPVRKGSGKSLELWALCKGKPTAGTVFWTDDTGRGIFPIKLAGEPACLEAFAVTVEPTDAEPLPAPTGPIVLLGK